jgi:hypothetical protein
MAFAGRMMGHPELHAVVEVAIREEGLWVELPAKPWPHFARLCGSTSDSEIALVVAVASSHGRADQSSATSASALFDQFPQVLPGGIAVVTSERSVFPTCCCGLETWPEWAKIVETGTGPWMGHDPSPFVEIVDDEVLVWSDGGMGGKPLGEHPIVFSRSDFVHALERTIKDLDDFVPLLRRWLGLHAPDRAKGLTARFKSRFIHPKERRG